MVAGSPNKAAVTPVEYAKDFAQMVSALQLTISDKSMVVPDSAHTQAFARKVTSIGIPMKVEGIGVDIGVNTSSAARRTTKKQRERIGQTRRRAARIGFLARRNAKARMLATTTVSPAPHDTPA